MARRYDSENAKRRILSACVKLFIEQGYNETKMSEILALADVSAGTFQNIFRTKDGILMELVQFMFENQFDFANKIIAQTGASANAVMLYATETAIQLTIAELNENLREIYIEAYTHKETAEYIHQQTSKKLYQIFGRYLPNYSESDFYELEIGSAGIMLGYMARPCDIYFTLEKKLERFLSMSMSAYSIPYKEQQEVLNYIRNVNIKQTANMVMQHLFKALAMKFDFSLTM